jgi:hypothetical protein
MMIRLSDKEASILLGATLMHWGVPFRKATKHELTGDKQALVDEASDRLIGLRDAWQLSHVQEGQEVYFSDQEAALLIAVVEDCLKECGNDPIELNLQLKTRERNDIETLLQRFLATYGSQVATHG